MSARQIHEEHWHDIRPLGNGENRVLQVGAPVAAGAIMTVLDTRNGLRRLTFGVRSGLNCTLTIQVDVLQTFATPQALIALPVPAGMYATTYNLPAPYSDGGYVTIPWPYMRLTLADTAGGAHPFTLFWARMIP